MATVRLSHAVFTNAPGVDGAGFRLVRAPTQDSQERRQISAWLEGLMPSREGQLALACSKFTALGKWELAVAVVHSSFARDDHLREGGWLAHALFALVDETRNAHLPLALLRRVLEFAPPRVSDRERLETYLSLCDAADSFDVPEPRPSQLRNLGFSNLSSFLRGAAALEGRTQPVEVPVTAADNPEGWALTLAGASGALPPRLRNSLAWACNVRTAPEGSLVGVAVGFGRPAPPPHAVADRYARWLWSNLEEGGDIRAVYELLGEWSIRSWRDLERAILQQEERGRPQPTPYDIPSSLEPAVGSSRAGWSGQSEEERTGGADSGRPRRGLRNEVSAEAPEDSVWQEMDRQYRALEESLKLYIDSRLYETGPDERLAPPPDNIIRRLVRRLLAFRPEIYFILLLVLVLLTGPCLNNGQKPGQDGHGRAVSERSNAVIEIARTGEARTAPRPPGWHIQEWRRLIRSDRTRVAEWLDEVAKSSLGAVDARTRSRVREIVRRLRLGNLPQGEADLARVALFEYVLAVRGDEDAPSRVTLSTRDVDAVTLRKALEALGLHTAFSAPSAEDETLQAAVVLTFFGHGVENR